MRAKKLIDVPVILDNGDNDHHLTDSSFDELDYHNGTETDEDYDYEDFDNENYDNAVDIYVTDDDVQKYALEEGMIFADVNVFRAALKEYSVRAGFNIKRVKNEKARVTVRCAAEGCPWRVHASPCDGVTYMVKTCNSVHTCFKVESQKEADSNWMAEKIVPALTENPEMENWELLNELKKYGVSPSYMPLYRAKKKAFEIIYDGHGKKPSQELVTSTRELDALSLSDRPSSVKCSFCSRKGHNKRSCGKRMRTRAPSKKAVKMLEHIPLAEVFEGIKKNQTLELQEDVPLADVFKGIKREQTPVGVANTKSQEEIAKEDMFTQHSDLGLLITQPGDKVYKRRTRYSEPRFVLMQPGDKVYKRRNKDLLEFY